MFSPLNILDSTSEISRIPKFGLLYMRRDWDDDRNVSGNGMQGRSQFSKQDEASLERGRREPLGGSGGMPPPENFEI